MRFRPGCASFIPVAVLGATALGRLPEVDARFVRHQERGLERPAEVVLGGLHLGGTERRAVRLGAVLFARAAETDVGADANERWTTGLGDRGSGRGRERVEIVAVVDLRGVPAVGLESEASRSPRRRATSSRRW